MFGVELGLLKEQRRRLHFGQGPGIVLFQEIFGVNKHIQGVVEQYALDGFVVLAPDIFWRQASRQLG